MKMLVRAVVTGFGFSLGAALFRKVSDKLGLGEEKDDKEGSGPNRETTATDAPVPEVPQGRPDPDQFE
jgi:hypothetical protein